MMRSLFAVIFILLLFSMGNAEPFPVNNIIITGKIVDRSTNLPIPYASIGIPNKPLGTLSDSLGNFSFTIGEENLSDTLRISMIGYQPLDLPIQLPAGRQLMIQLTPKVTELKEVIVTNSSDSVEIVGRKNTGKLLQISIHNKNSVQETIGSEMGMRYKIKQQHAYLKNFNFYISANSFNYIMLRINVYTVKQNMPDTLICSRQVFVTLNEYKTGWTGVDLRDENIMLPVDFIVTMQWVEKPNGKNW